MFGARIRALRRARGWTQAHLAAQGQVSIAYISMLERGREVHPTAPALGRLAAALAVDLADLVDVTRPLDVALPAPPPARGVPTAVEFQRLARVWPQIQPALRPYLVELANSLATMSIMLENPTGAGRESPPAGAGAEHSS